MLSVKQARFLAKGLKAVKKAAGVGAVLGAQAAAGAAVGLPAAYAFRGVNRATFDAKQKNQMTPDEFKEKLKTKGYFGRGRMYNRVRRGTIKLKGSSVFRPFAGQAGLRGAVTPRPKLRTRFHEIGQTYDGKTY